MARLVPWLLALFRGLLWSVAAVVFAEAFDLPLPPLLGGAVVGGVLSGFLEYREYRDDGRTPMSLWLVGLRAGLLFAAGALLVGSLNDIAAPQLLAVALGGGVFVAGGAAWDHRHDRHQSPEPRPDAVPPMTGPVGR